ncbi:YueI family protein [Paucilactobacillus kaifaensis]|uniref:YueI family protein n=1 Tax=Paucilactobacillus kaifaensis TaxID=2559921 RepID=UPI0010F4FAA1|nr:YueI family protein [Paucilactobacillus kaifaensis]
MPDNNIPTDQHLQSALYGTPKVNPDEQRKYLGTFRERVSLTISVAQLEQSNWVHAFTQEITQPQAEIIFFNGNIEQSQLKPYILAASKVGTNFTIKTNPDYHVNDQNLAIVVAAKKAIHINPIDVAKKYSYDQPKQDQQTKKISFWQKLFNK